MKSYTLADSVLPKRLHLSPEQEQALTDLADRIVAETLQENEDFIANDRRVDARIWKKVKSREQVHVYRTRRSGSKHRGSSNDVNEKEPSRPRLLSNNAVEQHQRDAIAAGRPLGFVNDEDEDVRGEETSRTNTHSSTSEGGSFALEDSVLAKTKPSYVPLIEASGVMDGSVEDAAFGALADTKYAWEVRNSYTKNDGFDGRKVLATLQRPSEEDPFRFVGVKWATRDYGTFMTRRDLVFLESSGMAFDSDGERVYYSLAHSIELTEVPTLDRLNIIRMNLSSCYIMRQLNDDKIDVYCRGYSDMGGEMPEGFSVSFFSAAVAGVSGMVECSYLKKLSWYMSRRRQSDSTGESRSSHCGVCGKSVNKLSSLVQPGSGCPICRLPVCSKCSVQKKLSIVSPDDVVQKQFSFCLSCVIEARKLPAWDVATALLKAT
ncbi:hypothetical protein F441_09132 [Phytophthora nicotianae CJ01A1]|uniref:FYVE-type domain-containing protein n=6 Tax=Phytophthora nicotianae TaxID=4792 RepID=W2Q6U9_PHYN3|nr:hypothetical protein PPTG_11690 [Phytophthora nicotianae INRA-310]ETI46460.1 hypothetical protein F443_09157 [Phytophthora nicotianae P1569]ETK86387.1 hypothetical protein L915_08981 [Phytophthora nicotianae]ETP16243.1 hypothetical protein F441_09132 [Phytophthora nicotianae CJ01A1]ETP44301.1 hypothetical protein F442_09094 [Phytophthora nicotianae P10297]ETL39812.1 hypothetical protein L916_08893 [Phytophthora nicotianae]